MATYTYKARRLDGAAVEGTLPAETEKAALGALDRMGLFPLELREEVQGGGEAQGKLGRLAQAAKAANSAGQAPSLNLDLSKFFQRRIGAETAARFARGLSDLVRAGVPALEALEIVSRAPEGSEAVVWGAKETKDDQRARLVLQDVRRDVAQGASLADALDRRPELFASTAVSIVRAGEEGGFLPEALRRVAVFGERENALKRKLKAALTYPALLGALSAGAVLFLLAWVVPQFSVIYQDLGSALPLPTRILIAIGNLLTGYWPLWVLALVGAVFGLQRLLTTEGGRRSLDGWLLKAPFLRVVVAQAAISRFGRTLSTLLSSGVGVLRAIEIAAEATGNGEFKDRLALVLGPIREGAQISVPLRDTRLFPPQVIEMIEVGQESGTLVEVLEQVGERADEEVDHSLRIFTTVLEPALIVCVAGVVFFVVLAALLPVFNLNSLIQ